MWLTGLCSIRLVFFAPLWLRVMWPCLITCRFLVLVLNYARGPSSRNAKSFSGWDDCVFVAAATTERMNEAFSLCATGAQRVWTTRKMDDSICSLTSDRSIPGWFHVFLAAVSSEGCSRRSRKCVFFQFCFRSSPLSFRKKPSLGKPVATVTRSEVTVATVEEVKRTLTRYCSKRNHGCLCSHLRVTWLFVPRIVS